MVYLQLSIKKWEYFYKRNTRFRNDKQKIESLVNCCYKGSLQNKAIDTGSIFDPK